MLKLENVIVTPHSIALTDEFYITMWQEIANQIVQMMRGEKPATLVNPEVWDKPEFQAKLKKFHEALASPMVLPTSEQWSSSPIAEPPKDKMLLNL